MSKFLYDHYKAVDQVVFSCLQKVEAELRADGFGIMGVTSKFLCMECPELDLQATRKSLQRLRKDGLVRVTEGGSPKWSTR